jgi:hypothetical protein
MEREQRHIRWLFVTVLFLIDCLLIATLHRIFDLTVIDDGGCIIY